MTKIPIRDTDNRIIDFVDAQDRPPPAPPQDGGAPAGRTESEPAEPRSGKPRRRGALPRPDQQRSMRALLQEALPGGSNLDEPAERRAPWRPFVAAGVLGVLVILASQALGSRPHAPRVQPDTLPTANVATPAVAAPPAAPMRLTRAIGAWAAPGSYLDGLNEGRVYTPTFQVAWVHNLHWVQIDVGQPAAVWVRAQDLPPAVVAQLPAPALAPRPMPPRPPPVAPGVLTRPAAAAVMAGEVAPPAPGATVVAPPAAAQQPAIAREDWNERCHPPMPCALPDAPAPGSAAEASRTVLQQLGLDPLGNAFDHD